MGYSPWGHKTPWTKTVYISTVCTWETMKFSLEFEQFSRDVSSWEIDGETVETVTDFVFLGSQITTDGDCSHEIKRRLLTDIT